MLCSYLETPAQSSRSFQIINLIIYFFQSPVFYRVQLTVTAKETGEETGWSEWAHLSVGETDACLLASLCQQLS